MSRALLVWRSLVVASSLEALRRKDLYVVVILTLLLVAGGWMFGFFGIRGLEVFIRDVTFSAIGIFSTILTVLIAARQIPEEVQRKTIYPLLARPITRWQFLVGKWLAASTTSILGFLILVLAARLMLLAFGVPVAPILWQYVALKMVGIVWLCAVTVGLSVYMTTGANVTICLILAFGSGAFNRFTMLLRGSNGLTDAGVSALFGVLPHYDFFDMGAKVVYDWPLIPQSVIWLMAGYAFVSSLLWLGVGWLRFRKQVV